MAHSTRSCFLQFTAVFYLLSSQVAVPVSSAYTLEFAGPNTTDIMQRPADPSLPVMSSNTFAFADKSDVSLAFQGLCPPSAESAHLPVCASMEEASLGGYWVRSKSFAPLVLAGAGLSTYGEVCWLPFTCRLTPLGRAAAQSCFAGKRVSVLGDSNGVNLFQHFHGFLGLEEARSFPCKENRPTEAQQYFHIPADKIVSESCWSTKRYSSESRSPTTPDAPALYNTTVEVVTLRFANDIRIETDAGGTLPSLLKYYWGSVVPAPDVILANVGLHDSRRLYAARSSFKQAGDPPLYSFDDDTDAPAYVSHLQALMSNLSAALLPTHGQLVWLLSPAINTPRQEPKWRPYSNNRRAMWMNGMAAALLKAHQPRAQLVHTPSLSAPEYPELHVRDDVVHLHQYHGAYYNAVRDIVVALQCAKWGARES